MAQAQLGRLAQGRRQRRPARVGRQRLRQLGLATRRRRRPARVRLVAVGQPVGALAHAPQHQVLLPAQAGVVRPQRGQQIGRGLAALAVTGDVAPPFRHRERQPQPPQQRRQIACQKRVLDRELDVHGIARRRDRAAAEEGAARESDDAATLLDEPSRQAALEAERIAQHAELVEELQLARVVAEHCLVAQAQGRRLDGAQLDGGVEAVHESDQATDDRRQAERRTHVVLSAGGDLERSGAEEQARELGLPAVALSQRQARELALDVASERHGRHAARVSRALRRGGAPPSGTPAAGSGRRATPPRRRRDGGLRCSRCRRSGAPCPRPRNGGRGSRAGV